MTTKNVFSVKKDTRLMKKAYAGKVSDLLDDFLYFIWGISAFYIAYIEHTYARVGIN